MAGAQASSFRTQEGRAIRRHAVKRIAGNVRTRLPRLEASEERSQTAGCLFVHAYRESPRSKEAPPMNSGCIPREPCFQRTLRQPPRLFLRADRRLFREFPYLTLPARMR